MDATVLYHKNCNDGLAAALVMKVFFDEMNWTAEYLPVQYGDKPPDNRKGEHLYIVDFCYDPQTLLELAESHRGVTVLDHHQKAFDMFEGYENKPGWRKQQNVHTEPVKFCHDLALLEVNLSDSRSGAGCAFTYIDSYMYRVFFQSESGYKIRTGTTFFKRLETIVRAVEDRDLWKFQLKDTLAYYHMLRVVPPTVDHWFRLLLESEEDFNARLEHAKKQESSYNWCVQTIASCAGRGAAFGDFVYILECHPDYTSAVADLLTPRSPFVVLFYINPDKQEVYVSLRSSEAPHGLDVNKIASKFGGGGHKHAAGCKFTLANIREAIPNFSYLQDNFSYPQDSV